MILNFQNAERSTVTECLCLEAVKDYDEKNWNRQIAHPVVFLVIITIEKCTIKDMLIITIENCTVKHMFPYHCFNYHI